MDAFQFLRTEHRKASQLLRRLKNTPEVAERDRLFRELKQELDSDAQVEREFLYPPLLQREATADVAGGGIHDLDQLNELLASMSAMPKEGGEWTARLDQLQRAVEGHIRKEEDGLFRKALGVFNKDQREDLGERMRSHKLRLIQGGAGRTESARPAPEAADPTAAEGARARPSAAASETAEEAVDDVGRLADAAKRQSKSFAATQARYVSGQIGGLARAVHQTASNLDQEEQAEMSLYLKRAASGLARLSDTLHDGDVDAIVAKSSRFARRQPAVFMGGAVVMGFLLTRFLKSSEERAGRHHTP